MTAWEVLGGLFLVFFAAIIVAMMAIAKRADERIEAEERMNAEWEDEQPPTSGRE